MGNYLSNTKYTLHTIGDFKTTAGTCDEPVYAEEHKSEELIGLFSSSPISSMLNLVSVYQNDKQYLNRFLTGIHNHLRTHFQSDSPFAESFEGAKLLLSSLVSSEEVSDEHLELIGSDIGTVDKSKVKSVKLFRCVYEFPGETLNMYNRVKSASTDTVKVGVYDGEMMLFSPTTIPDETNTILFKWFVFELEDEEVYVMPLDLEGVVVENGKIVNPVLNQLSLLETAGELLKENNDRALKSKVDQFTKWKEEVLEKKEVLAMVGGSEKGNLVPLTEFFDNLDIL